MGGVSQSCVLSPTFYYIIYIFIGCICLVIIIQSFRKIHAWAEMKDALKPRLAEPGYTLPLQTV